MAGVKAILENFEEFGQFWRKWNILGEFGIFWKLELFLKMEMELGEFGADFG